MFFKNYKLKGYSSKDFSFLDLKDNEVEIPFGTEHPGASVGSNWWNETEYIAIEYKNYVIVYGELIVNSNIKINDIVSKGQELGRITPVLKQNKNNRPINMLHLELYDKEHYTEPKEWIDIKPKGLLNSIILLKELI